MEPQKHLFEKGKSSSKPSFLGCMLIFRGVVKLDHETPSKVEHKNCFELPPPRKKKRPWKLHPGWSRISNGFLLDEFPLPLDQKKRKEQDTVTAGTWKRSVGKETHRTKQPPFGGVRNVSFQGSPSAFVPQLIWQFHIRKFHPFLVWGFSSISTGAGFLQLVVEMRNGISSQKLSDIRNPEFLKIAIPCQPNKNWWHLACAMATWPYSPRMHHSECVALRPHWHRRRTPPPPPATWPIALRHCGFNCRLAPKKTQAGFTVNLVGAVYPFEKY